MHELIADPIRIAAEEWPDRTAVACGEAEMTFAEFDAAIDNAVFFMEDCGIEPDDIVAVLDGNSLSYATLFWAAHRSGTILLPINCQVSETEWRRQLAITNCRHLFLGNAFKSYSSLCDRTHLLRPHYRAADRPIEKKSYQNLAAPAMIMFTSGSTGLPRGVRLSWGNIFYSAAGANEALNMSTDDVWLATLPFYHIGGISILFRAALSGSKVQIFPHFDAPAILNCIVNISSAVISVVPTMLRELIIADTASVLNRCKAIILGGAGFDDRLKSEIESRNLPVLTTYGMTETASMITLQPLDQAGEGLESSGVILPYRELSISSDEQILVKGMTLFNGYITEDVSLESGWFNTGDIGCINEEGGLHVTGRSERLIVSGGENIDLNYIERILFELAAVESAVVLPRSDAKWGERPVAFVVLNDPALSESELQAHLRESVGTVFVPDRIIILEDIPLTGSGKTDRQALRKRYKDIFEEYG